MKKLIFLMSLLSSLNVFADDIYLSTDNVVQSSNDIISSIMIKSGPIDTKTIQPTLHSSEKINVKIIDAQLVYKDLEQLSSYSFDDADSLIIIGDKSSTKKVSSYLLGFGSDNDYLVINKIKDNDETNVIAFDKPEVENAEDTANSLIKALFTK